MHGLHIVNGEMFLVEEFLKRFFRNMILMCSLYKNSLYSLLSLKYQTEISFEVLLW